MKKLKVNNKEELDRNLIFKVTPLRDVVTTKKFGSQIIPFMCSLKAAPIEIPDYIKQKEFENHSRAPIDLILTIDISGSMAGSKMTLLRDAVLHILDILNENDRLSIV